jgi:AraC-like DNA-binding protein
MKPIPGLPLVRLNLVLPIVRELERRRLDVDTLLASSGLARDALFDQDVFVAPTVVNRFLEAAAAAARDPNLCARVGASLDDAGWGPLVEAATHAKSLGEFLIRFIRAAQDEASSAQHSLEIGPQVAVFRERRTGEQEIVPAQNDAFTAAYLLRLLQRGAGRLWSPEEVSVTVSEPAALPDRFMEVRVVRGDRMGARVRFPSEWLVQPFAQRSFLGPSGSRENRLGPPTHFLESLRQSLTPHLDAEDLGVDFVVQLLGTNRQSLQRTLRACGTTLSTEIRELKKSRASEALVQTDRSVSDIAASVGFRSPASFTRAFRAWTGESPSEYRKNRRAV